MGKYIDLTGKRFGEIEVIKDTNERHKNGSHIWKCKCSCGKVIYLPTNVLKNQKSCGCKANRLEDLSGQKFGKLTAISINHDTKDKRVRWNCICDCGSKTVVRACNLKSGEVKSCGCLANENSKTHGMTNTRLYRIYKKMYRRCYRPKTKYYENYGGRGITICSEWLGEHGFEDFAKWSMENGYSDNLSIDRKDNDKGYSPDNCRWATAKEQANNTRSTVFLTYKRETKSASEWSEITGIRQDTLTNRKRNGWTDEECIETPIWGRMGPRKRN